MMTWPFLTCGGASERALIGKVRSGVLCHTWVCSRHSGGELVSGQGSEVCFALELKVWEFPTRGQDHQASIDWTKGLQGCPETLCRDQGSLAKNIDKGHW